MTTNPEAPRRLTCLRCGHSWWTRTAKPLTCPSAHCRSAFYALPRKSERARKATAVAAALVFLALSWVRPARATISFPTDLDSNATLHLMVTGDTYIASFHNTLKDAIIALEAKVGVNTSAVTTSLDYLVTNAGSVAPGHRHTGASVNFADGSVGTPGLRFGNPVTDGSTGFFHPTAGAIAFSGAGSEIVRLTSSGVAILNAGASNLPLDVAGTVRIQSANTLAFGGVGSADFDVTLARTATRLLQMFGQLRIDSIQGGSGEPQLTLRGYSLAPLTAALQVFESTSDAQPSVLVTGSGQLRWGDGTNPVDTKLYRSTAGLLKTDTGFAVGTNSVALANGSNDNVSIPTAEYIEITGPTAAFSVTGLQGGTDGRRVTLRSTVSQTLTVVNLATSSAANQINTLNGANIL